MIIEANKSLKSLNTFGVDVRAKYFAQVTTTDEFKELIQTEEFQNNEYLIIGGGSNILFTQDFDGLVIHNLLGGIEVLREEGDHVWLRVASGENWHEIVMYAVGKGLGGIENLALIPGSAGATPVQNIGAYGVEIKDTIETVRTIEIATGETRVFAHDECKFGYRTSIFKTDLHGQYFITGITLKLTKNKQPTAHYASLDTMLADKGITEPTIRDIAESVIAIRQSKLPDPAVLGNAGSFFKNPEVNRDLFEKIHALHPDMPFYEMDNGQVKIPGGWLIDTAGWRGRREGDVGSHEKQALVLVNYGSATGAEVATFAHAIQTDIREKFGIDLEPEVTIL